MGSPLFILGAGFNKDAKGEVGPDKGKNMYSIEYENQVDYPLVSDLYKCFGLERSEQNISVEEMFSNAISENDYQPLNKLYDKISEADYYLAYELANFKDRSSNCYLKFLSEFKSSSFLTFNYDSLVEAILFKFKRWYPHDGYGVHVEVEYNRIDTGLRESSCKVLHLHGSFCINTAKIDLIEMPGDNMSFIQARERPGYLFDPDRITSLFSSCNRAIPDPGNLEEIKSRVIAPVPDKTEGLKKSFVQETYKKAKSLLMSSDTLISIGYSFNPLDKNSYDSLIRSFNGRHIIIDPNAEGIARLLKESNYSAQFVPITSTLKEWVDDGFCRLDCKSDN